MSLDLGAVVGRVVLEDVEFQRTYVRVVRQMGQLGSEAASAAKGTGILDEGLGAVSASADKAAVGLGRAAKATGETAASETKAAAAAARHAQALTDVAAVSARVTGASDKVQVSTLREYAANQRLAASSAEAGSAQQLQARETARLASAQASAIAASRSLAAAQKETTGGALAGSLSMAKSLGLLIGAVEAGKAVLDIGKQAVDFQQKMLLIQTSAGQSAAEVRKMTSAVLAMAPQVATSPDKLADALYHVEQNGAHGKDALDALRVGAEGAKIGMADVEDTTNTMTIAMASGIKGVSNLQQAMGFMIATVGTGDMRLKDLNEALSGGILAVAKGFGVSLRDVAAVLATLGDNGIRGADAATALRQTMMGFSSPMKAGETALRGVGLQFDSLRKDMQGHGLVYAMNDLEKHMASAGITGSKVGGFITQAFGKRAGAGIAVLMGEVDRLNIKFDEAQKGANTFASRWQATTHTAAFAFDALGARIQSAGVRFASAALPLATVVGSQLGAAVNDVIHVLGALGPTLGVAFKGAGALIEGAAFALHGITAALSFLSPVIKVVATAWAGMWLAQAGARLAVLAITTVSSAIEAVPAKFAAAQASVVGFWTGSAAAATAGATTTAEEAALMSGAADVAATEVVAAGETASAGWAGLAGPIGIAAGAVLGIITLFHHSSTASKEATDAAKAYADVLTEGGTKSDLIDAITKQLNDNNLPQTLAKLNSALGRTAFTGKQFTDAIRNGNPALGTLHDRLEAIVKAGTQVTVTTGRGASAIEKQTPAARAAAKALKDLTDQSIGLSKATKKDLIDTKTFAGVSSSVDKVTASLRGQSKVTTLTETSAKQYAAMAGLVVDKNGVAAASYATVARALNKVDSAYEQATETGSNFLAALNSFAQSTGSAEERAKLIGQTLVAANGDVLNFAGSMNAGAVAAHQLDTDIASAAKSAGKSSGGFLASIVDLKNGTIDYTKTAATPLINGLQAMQTAAMNAAQETFQHSRAMKSGKAAADDAYNTYRRLTSGALVAQAKQLGITGTQARALAKTYFGMPKNVKTLIESEGSDPVITVLNKIGQLLAFIAGKPWNPKVGVDDKTPAPLSAIQRKMNGIVDRTYNATITVSATIDPSAIRAQNLLDNIRGSNDFRITNKSSDPRLAAQGTIVNGNVRGPGGPTSDKAGIFALSDGEAVIPAKAVAQHRGLVEALIHAGRGMASGGVVGSLASFLASMGLSRAGIAGVLGNAQIESSMRLGAYNAKENAHGLFQWEGGRWSALQSLARHLGVGATSQAAEFAMLRNELSRMPGLLHTLRSGGSAGSKAAAFDAIFERSSGSSRGQRMSAAQQFMSQLASGHLTAGGNGLSQSTGTSGVVSAANALGKLIKGGRDHTKGVAAADVVGDMVRLESALAKAGAPASLVNKLTRQNKELSDAAAKRNHAASQLQKANAAVKAATDLRSQDHDTFKSANLGVFDVTSAGADADGRVTSGGLRASEQQAVTRIRKWATDMHKLIGLKIFPATYLRQLLGKGPDALGTVDAILGMSAGDLKSFAANEKTIDTLSGSIAAEGAHKLDDPGVIAAQKQATYWNKQVAKQEHSIEHVVENALKEVAAEVSRLNVSSKLQYKAGDLYVAVKTDESRSRHRKPTK